MFDQLLDHLEVPATVLGILATTFLLGYFFRRFFFRFIADSSLVIQNDPTNYRFLGHAVSALIYVVGFSWAIYEVNALKSVASSLLAGAGILAVAVGFASQHALSNVVSGIFIVIFKPFRVNDRLRIRDTMQGVVEDITLRHTVIRDFENRRIIIPNSIISEEVIVNADFEEDGICKWVEIGIAYEADIDEAKRILREEAEAHPLTVDRRSEEAKAEGRPIVQVRVLRLAEYSVVLRAWVWAKNSADAFQIGCDLFESVKKRFDREGIRIPLPHMMVQQVGNGR